MPDGAIAITVLSATAVLPSTVVWNNLCLIREIILQQPLGVPKAAQVGGKPSCTLPPRSPTMAAPELTARRACVRAAAWSTSAASAPDGTARPRRRSEAHSRHLRAQSPGSPSLSKRADTIWIEPRFDAEIAYTEITGDGMVRHPSFKGLHLTWGTHQELNVVTAITAAERPAH